MKSPLETLLEPQYADKRDPPVHGVVTAKVTGRMGDGQYELQYLSMGADTPSAPARVMAPTAGNKRGAWAMPEVGDEVVVAFDNGDTNMPIILGAVWNDESPNPEAAKPSDENNIRAFVSRSGHCILFDDAATGGKIEVRTKNGHTLVLDDAVAGKIKIEGPKGTSIELDDTTMGIKLVAPLKIELQTAQLVLAAGGVSMAPPTPSPGTPPTPPGPVSIASPLQISLKGLAIRLEASMIELVTTGNPTTSLVIVDGVPFGLHGHLPAASIGTPGATGPVNPGPVTP